MQLVNHYHSAIHAQSVQVALYDMGNEIDRKIRQKGAGGGVLVGGPVRNVWVPDGEGYIVTCVLSWKATGIKMWSVVLNDKLIKHYTDITLPYVIKNALTLIIPFADSRGLRELNEKPGNVLLLDCSIWPKPYNNIGWYAGKDVWYPDKNLAAPVEEQLFCIIVTEEQLEELRDS